MAKWLDKYDTPKAENGIEGTMGGLTDVGFNYNGAWGGPSMKTGGWLDKYQTGGNIQPPMAGAMQPMPTYAMGGSLPGSVGFMYARTQSPAPSNGPYAKKTKASAQNGSMTYYQHGLDWKPRNISQNGRELALQNQGSSTDSQMLARIKADAEAAEMARKKKAESKRTYVGPARSTTKQDEQKTMMMKRAYAAANPNAGIDEKGNLYEKNPERDISGKARPNTRAAKMDKAAEHALNAMDAAGIAMGVGALTKAGYNVARKALAESMESGLLSKLSPKPTSLSSSVDDVGNKFKSEIDWGAWNPETPNYPELINEYNAIEESTKNAGTWMTQPRDYSIFSETDEMMLEGLKDKLEKGILTPSQVEVVQKSITRLENQKIQSTIFQETPEQFIQQQSSHFKKAFPQGFEKTYRGTYGEMNTENLFKNYPEGRGIFTGDIETGKHYTGDKGKLFELFHPKSSNSYNIDVKGRSWREVPTESLPGMESKKTFLGKPVADTDDIATWAEKNNVDYVTMKNIFDGVDAKYSRIVNNKPGNFLKSTTGNVGFFDMTNPNIYKGLVPAGIVGAAALEQKKQGGVIKDDMGQWAHPGEVTEIGSNRITMKGVDYPVLGISDEGDTQLMQPGGEYKFKGKKVTEYPMAQRGKQLPPIYTSNRNDLRIKEYQDSLSSYNKGKALWNKNYFDMFDLGPGRTPLYPKEYDKLPTHVSKYLSKEYVKNIGGPKAVGLIDTDTIDFPVFKKPVQPVEYKPEPAKFERQPMRKPSMELIEREIPKFSQKSIEKLPYRVEYRDEKGKPTSTYFADEPSSREFWKSAPGEKTGYYQRKNGGWLKKYDNGGPVLESLDVNKTKQFITNWNNSPMAKQMLEASVDKDDPVGFNSTYADKIREKRNYLTKSTPITVQDEKSLIASRYGSYAGNEDKEGLSGFNQSMQVNPTSVSSALGNAFASPSVLLNNALGSNEMYTDVIAHDPESYSNEIFIKSTPDKNQMVETAIHELSHASDYSGYFMPASDIKKIDKFARGWDVGMPMRKKLDDFQSYVAEPTETRARLMNFRYNAANQGIYDPFKEKINLDQLKKYKQTPGGYDPLEQLKYVYTDQQIVELLNSVSKTPKSIENNTAKYGGWLNKYK